jgi:hypothetical protein
MDGAERGKEGEGLKRRDDKGEGTHKLDSDRLRVEEVGSYSSRESG